MYYKDEPPGPISTPLLAISLICWPSDLLAHLFAGCSGSAADRLEIGEPPGEIQFVGEVQLKGSREAEGADEEDQTTKAGHRT